MKKKLLLMLTLCLLAQWSVAQAPKWVDKAKRAVFSVVTYDQNDKILNTGNGFFVNLSWFFVLPLHKSKCRLQRKH